MKVTIENNFVAVDGCGDKYLVQSIEFHPNGRFASINLYCEEKDYCSIVTWYYSTESLMEAVSYGGYDVELDCG